MVLVHTAAELRALLLKERAAGTSRPSVAHLASSAARWAVGLVPTMGALHEGHLSLVRRSLKENDVTVVSIFLNPTQFNNKKDLERYPSNLEADCRLLEATGQGIVAFAPSVQEMYPEPDTRRFSYPPTDSVMEGKFRPGHFNGVCQIVSKLFQLVEPRRAYFGEKDFQQIAVVRRMVEALRLPVTVVPCPIVRGEGGLALSSRNALLSENEKLIARNIYKILSESLALTASHSVPQVRSFVVTAINAVPGLEVQYFSIVDGKTLADVASWSESDDIVGCITVFCGKLPVRLIDHIRYK